MYIWIYSYYYCITDNIEEKQRGVGFVLVLNIFSVRSIVELLIALTVVKVAGLVLRELFRKEPCG